MACKDKIAVVVKNVIETVIVQRDGWLQYFELIPYQNGFVFRLKGYFGGDGTNPPTEYIGWYMGADGWVEDIEDAYVIGEKGSTPKIGLNGNWFIDGVDTGLPAVGTPGLNKIADWAPVAVPQGEQRLHNGIWWEAVVDTTALQEPGVVSEDIWKKAINQVGEETEGSNFTIEDENGNVAFEINYSGYVNFKKIGNELKEAIINIDFPPEIDGNIEGLSDVNHIITYGQSLSVGQTEKLISTTPLFNNLICFDGVVRTSPYDKSLTGDIYPINRRISFEPLVERLNDGTSAGILRETPTSGTVESFAIKLNKAMKSKMEEMGIQLLGSAPGWGATTIAALSKGTAYYTQLIQDVQAGYDLSILQGKQYKTLAVTFTQGESDKLGGQTFATYRDRLIQLKNDLNTDIKAITGQVESVALVTYQTNTTPANTDVSSAQLFCALNEPNIYMATPMYFMEYNDNLHITAASSKKLGYYYGKAISKIVFNNSEWRPVHVKSHSVQGRILKLNMHVPASPLVFSQCNGVDLQNKGFSVIKNGNDILESVSIGGDGVSINLVCTEPATSDCIVRYGFNTTVVPNSTVNLGNLRDSNGKTEEYIIDGNKVKLDNWCPVFEYILN